MNDPIIRVSNLEKRYRLWTHARPTNIKERVRLAGSTARARARIGGSEGLRRDVWALRGVSFDVGRGEVLGVIGRNGAGKSTLLSILARITEPTGGFAEIHGRVSSLLEVGTGFHPELTGRDNVFLNGAILGMKRNETARKFDEIVDFSGVRDFIDIPVKRYSTGMQVRLAFAVAAHLDPEVLLLDEVLAVGDAAFQARCHKRVEEMTQSGRTVLFVSHDVNSVARLCKHAILLQDGQLAFAGNVDDAIDHYLHGQSSELVMAGEREGRGTVRVRQVVIEGVSSPRVTTGAPARFTVELDVHEPMRLSDLRITLTVKHSTGGSFLVLSTDFDSGPSLPDRIVEGPLSLVCEVEAIPLRPASYVVSAVVERFSDVLDRFDDAGSFVLLSGDVFGPRAVPTSYPAPVAVRHQWGIGNDAGTVDPEAADVSPATA
jgi:lipopolysaccharide transport system ATP-binding protein